MVSAVYSALYALQHRGQESCGIALNVDGVLRPAAIWALSGEVFTKRVLEELPRGSKDGYRPCPRKPPRAVRSRSNAQPMILHHCKGAMAVCHNGNLVNAPKLRRKLEMSGSIFTARRTLVIAYLPTQNRLLTPNIEMAVSRTMDDIEGAYSSSL